MNAADQVRLAGRLNAALQAGELEVVRHRQEGSYGHYVPAELVDVVGALMRLGFVLRETGVGPPAVPPRLFALRGKDD